VHTDGIETVKGMEDVGSVLVSTSSERLFTQSHTQSDKVLLLGFWRALVRMVLLLHFTSLDIDVLSSATKLLSPLLDLGLQRSRSAHA
jgi:hypothetical protein